MAIPRTLLPVAACCPHYFGVQVIDVKDAFLMAPQPNTREHLASYLVGAEFYGLLIKSSKCGKSMLDMREMQDVEVKKFCPMEVVTWRVGEKPEKHLAVKR